MFARFFRPAASSATLFPIQLHRFWSLALCIVAASLVWPAKSDAQNTAATQTQANVEMITTLEAGKPIERELAGGQSHTYQITLAAGEYLNLLVEQRGIDVVVILVGRDNKELAKVDSPNGSHGRETLLFLASAEESYHLKIYSAERVTEKGKYKLLVTALRKPTETDSALIRAFKLDNEIDKLRAKSRVDEAIALAKEVLAIRETNLGAAHFDTAISVSKLARLYYNKGDYSTAFSLYQRALATLQRFSLE